VVEQAQPCQGITGEGQQRFANVVAREFLAFEHEDAVAVFGKNGGGRCPRRPAADDDHIKMGVGTCHVLGKQLAQSESDASAAD
jgi:hypothetical protein